MEKVSEDLSGLVAKKKSASLTPAELEVLDRSDLIAEVTRLQAHVSQLKCLLAKKNAELNGGSAGDDLRNNASRKKGRQMDFKRYRRRHVALKFLYLGWDYQGYVVQEDTLNTIETKLFDALTKAHLIESRETSNYHRCGRTDKGVSAFEQVITIDVRTNLKDGVGVFEPEDFVCKEDDKYADKEIQYVGILNRLLPRDIRVIAWTPVPVGFSARFDCKARVYRYFFPRGTLDMEAMQKACDSLVGEHDFRNLCKMDVGNGVTKFVRNVFDAKVLPVDGSSFSDSSSSVLSGTSSENSCLDFRSMVMLVIKSNAFLWHQIRCIAAVLMLVGMGLEKPEIISELLNVEKNERKPQYSLALELPLCLFESHYEDLEWIYDFEELNFVRSHLEGIWMEHQIKSTMIRSMIDNIESKKHAIRTEGSSTVEPVNACQDPQDYGACILGDKQLLKKDGARSYKPLMSRPTCESLEDRIEHYAKKRKVQ